MHSGLRESASRRIQWTYAASILGSPRRPAKPGTNEPATPFDAPTDCDCSKPCADRPSVDTLQGRSVTTDRRGLGLCSYLGGHVSSRLIHPRDLRRPLPPRSGDSRMRSRGGLGEPFDRVHDQVQDPSRVVIGNVQNLVGRRPGGQ